MSQEAINRQIESESGIDYIDQTCSISNGFHMPDNARQALQDRFDGTDMSPYRSEEIIEKVHIATMKQSIHGTNKTTDTLAFLGEGAADVYEQLSSDPRNVAKYLHWLGLASKVLFEKTEKTNIGGGYVNLHAPNKVGLAVFPGLTVQQWGDWESTETLDAETEKLEDTLEGSDLINSVTFHDKNDTSFPSYKYYPYPEMNERGNLIAVRYSTVDRYRRVADVEIAGIESPILIFKRSTMLNLNQRFNDDEKRTLNVPTWDKAKRTLAAAAIAPRIEAAIIETAGETKDIIPIGAQLVAMVKNPSQA